MAYLIGGFFRVLNPYTSGQLLVQRYCTLEKVKSVKMYVLLRNYQAVYCPLPCVFVR